MKGVNIFLADGFEDVEALATFDVLRRGGVRANLVAIGDEPFVASSHGLMVGVENFLPEIDMDHAGTTDRDVMIFPGGMPGSKNLACSKLLIREMRAHFAAGGTVAAICAAPGLVLGQLDCWDNTAFTCFDGFEDVPASKGGVFCPKPAIADGRVITGRSAGHAIPFALEILRKVKGDDAAAQVGHQMYLD